MERAALQLLFEAAGEPITRERLIERITDTPWDFDPHRLDVLVHRLRARVRAATGAELPMRALRGQGYLLTA
ncbi:Heme response regulator HssR [compost metagenome]